MRTKIIVALFVVIGLAIGIRLGLDQARLPVAAVTAGPDYDSYVYGRGEEAKIIDVGTQPLGTPATFITECLLHDRILQQQLAATGWQLREHGYRSGYDMLPYLDGRLDVMVQGDIPALIAIQQHRVEIVAVCSLGYNAIIASHTLIPSELKGLRVGYPVGTASHFALERTLASAGLAMQDIVSVPMSPQAMQAALRRRQVEAVAVWEPVISTILSNVEGSAIISKSDTYTFVTVDQEFASHHPAALHPVLAAILRAARWGRQDEENLRTNLRWDREATLRFAGASDVEPTARWIRRLRDDTIDNPSFPMLPLEVRTPGSFQHQQFEFLKTIGRLPAQAEWRQASERVNIRCLPDIIEQGRVWQIDRFDYAPNKLYPDKERAQ
jgi:hypothetical protein